MTEDKKPQKLVIIGRGASEVNLDALIEALNEQFPEGVEVTVEDDELAGICVSRLEDIVPVLPFEMHPIEDFEFNLPLPTKPPPFRSRDYRKKK